MSKGTRKIKSTMLYAGLTKEEFDMAFEEFANANRRVLYAISGVLFGVMILLLGGSFFLESIAMNRLVYLGGAVVIGFIFFGDVFYCKNRPYLVSSFVIIFCVVCYTIGIFLGVYTQPDELCVTFIMLCVLLQTIFYMRPIISIGLEVTAIAIFLILGSFLKDPYVYQSDMVDALGYGFAGAALCIFTTSIKASNARNVVVAEKASASKTVFLFNMSHDIRTPMNAIIGFNNIAKKSIHDEEKLVECLDKVGTSSEYLLSLINDVLDMSRAESGKVEIATEATDIHKAGSAIFPMLEDLARSKDIDFSVEFEGIIEPYVKMDIFHVDRVLINLISNAIKYTNEGGKVIVKIEQCGHAKDGFAKYEFCVSDNGIGMSEEFQKEMFQAFSRENTATISGNQGTGLGLAITDKFVTAMGGKISVSSQVGKGSAFIVSLPLEIVESEKEITEIVESQGDAEINLKGKKILLVEDNELNREIAVEILSEEGAIIEEAENGQVAVDIVKEKGPEYYDVILMDIQMPVMDGYEATKAIREMFSDKHIPIIALSANAFKEDKDKSKAAGMDDHIAKPINVPVLLSVLKKYIR